MCEEEAEFMIDLYTAREGLLVEFPTARSRSRG